MGWLDIRAMTASWVKNVLYNKFAAAKESDGQYLYNLTAKPPFRLQELFSVTQK